MEAAYEEIDLARLPATLGCIHLKTASKMCICMISKMPAQVCQFSPL